MHRPPERFSITATCLALLLPTLLSGCFWVPMSDWHNAVWSDDGEEIAFVQRSFFERRTIERIERQSFQFEVYRSSESDPNDASLVAGPLSGDIQTLYFMGSAGYLVAGQETSEWSDDTNPLKTWSYDLIDLDGTVVSLAEVIPEVIAEDMLQCGDRFFTSREHNVLDVIPSPDGSILASLSFAGSTCEGGEVLLALSLSFLQAPGLQAIGEPIDIDTGALLSPGGHRLLRGWLADGRFAVSNLDQEEAWIIEPGGAPVLRALPGEDCLETPTTSGEFRADGRQVWIDTDGTISFHDEELWSKVFGCDAR